MSSSRGRSSTGVTGSSSWIRPLGSGLVDSIPNGIPLRRDLHRLFDLGYVTVRPNMRLAVSGKLRDDYANGRVYYELEGREIRIPKIDALHPDTDALSWHEAEVFLGQ